MASNSGGDDQNIAIAIQTTADLQGTGAARADVGALSREAQAATAAIGRASEDAAAGQQTLATATQNAARQASGLGAAAGGASASLGALGKTGVSAGASVSKGALQATADVDALTLAANTAIGQFEALGKTVDVSSTEAVAAYRRQGDALAANLVSLDATEQQVNRIGASIQKVERAAGAALVPAVPQSSIDQIDKIPRSTRTAANSLGILTQAALTGTGSLESMAISAGGVAYGFAAMSDSAKLAASAAGIGALVTVGVLLYETYKKAKGEMVTAADPAFIAHLGNESVASLQQQLQRQRALVDEAQKQAAATATGTILDIIPRTAAYEAQKNYEQQARNLEALTAKVTELAHAEHLRNIELVASASDQVASNALSLKLETEKAARQRDDYELSLEANDVQRQQNAQQIAQSFQHRDATGQLVALTAEEVRLKNQLLAQNDAIAHAQGEQLRYAEQIALQTAKAQVLQGSDKVETQVEGKLWQIELERQAQIKATGDVVTANEAAEQKKRDLYRQTAQVANDNAKSIFDVLRSSQNSALKAVGTFGENIRRVVIGADAARALVRAAIEAAEALASAATGDFRGAELHGASALAFGKAAAVGAQESLGGGGTGGVPSSGSGASAGAESFTPKASAQGGGTQVINLYTVNPYSREAIGVVSYELGRAGVLKRPITIPPTTGLIGATG